MMDIRLKSFMGIVVASLPIALSFMCIPTARAARGVGGPDGKPVKVASLSFAPEKWNKEVNLRKMEALARAALSPPAACCCRKRLSSRKPCSSKSWT